MNPYTPATAVLCGWLLACGDRWVEVIDAHKDPNEVRLTLDEGEGTWSFRHDAPLAALPPMARTHPSGCRACGLPERGHFRRWTLAAGWHGGQQPTQDQIKARMIARRAERIVSKAGSHRG